MVVVLVNSGAVEVWLPEGLPEGLPVGPDTPVLRAAEVVTASDVVEFPNGAVDVGLATIVVDKSVAVELLGSVLMGSTVVVLEKGGRLVVEFPDGLPVGPDTPVVNGALVVEIGSDDVVEFPNGGRLVVELAAGRLVGSDTPVVSGALVVEAGSADVVELTKGGRLVVELFTGTLVGSDVPVVRGMLVVVIGSVDVVELPKGAVVEFVGRTVAVGSVVLAGMDELVVITDDVDDVDDEVVAVVVVLLWVVLVTGVSWSLNTLMPPILKKAWSKASGFLAT